MNRGLPPPPPPDWVSDNAREFPDCPKCGRVDPRVRWVSGRTKYAFVPNPWGCYRTDHPESPHFDLTCSRCQYRWQVAE